MSEPVDLDPLDVALPDALGRAVAGLPVHLPAPVSTTAHAHRRGELLYAISGRLSVETDDGLWMIPASHAMWIPGGVRHAAHAHGALRAACIFIQSAPAFELSSTCELVRVEPLLREVIFRLLGASVDPLPRARIDRLAEVMCDELGASPSLDAALPWPRGGRMVRLVNAMIETPSRRIGLAEWAGRIGASERTLTRWFWRELGMSPTHWRQHLHVRLAMQQLAEGRQVGNVAFDLGYDSTSAFIAVFKAIAGVTPGRFQLRH